jgi:hypothetical protein
MAGTRNTLHYHYAAKHSQRRSVETKVMTIHGIRWVLVGVLLAVLASIPLPVAAVRDGFGATPQSYAPSTAQRARVTLEQAADAVARATGGRILDAKAVGNEYRIKVLTRRGEVRVFYVNADTGSMHE